MLTSTIKINGSRMRKAGGEFDASGVGRSLHESFINCQKRSKNSKLLITPFSNGQAAYMLNEIHNGLAVTRNNKIILNGKNVWEKQIK